ncbi:Alpha/Beta hydrolase protein [Xylaria sp. FL0043]|nr:Alpha/Beta hydrolase protein [Xylaria sp. FL0043]
MEKIESGQVSRSKGEKDSFVDLLSSSNARPRQSRLRECLRNRILIYILFALVFYCSLTFRARFQGHSHDHALNEDSRSGSTELWTEWLDIEPSEKLKWQPCFGIYGPKFQCARLTVPMDYTRPLNESTDNPKVHLALFMLPGAGRTQDPSTYGSAPLLINPGGPGGSGVVFAQARATSLQLLAGDQHDVIGFDPRGVGASTPKADCFASPNSPNGVLGRNVAYMNRLTWLLGAEGIGLTNSSDVALTLLDARTKAVAKLCQRVDEAEGDGSIFRHIGTPNTARDMLSIIEAWDEWRSSSQAVQDVQPETAPQLSEHQNSDDDEKSKSSLQGKLVYWGFSYGTFLGATFASMFPDKVGRLILDGVVHADRYVNPNWETSTTDADAIWDRFFVYCAEAGTACSFYRAGDGPEDVRKRFEETLSMLKEQPATVVLPDMSLPALVTASDVKKSIFFGGLYAPIVGFPVIAELLNHAFNGRLGEIAQGAGMATLCGNLTLPLWPDDAMRGIACGDKRYKLNENVTRLQDRYEKAACYSWFADVWFGAEPNLGCNGWGIKSKAPSMPWHDHPAHKPAPIETSFPILFLSNTLDPVTPLGHALDMTRKFANASVIEQDGIGHCSLSCPSSCTIAHLQAYLNEGIVPPPPRFKSDSGNEGEWPTCKCFDRPWTSSGYEAEDSPYEMVVNKSHRRAYEELRAQFFTSTLSQQLDHDNPLKTYLIERSGLALNHL